MAGNGEHQVIPFRPRATREPGERPPVRGWDRSGQGQSAQVTQLAHHNEPDDLSQYERSPEEPDEYRHRMIANVAAGLFAIALTSIGLWLAITITDLRKKQDCVLYGLRNCGSITDAVNRRP